MDEIVNNGTYNEIIDLLVKEKGLEISKDNSYLKNIFENELKKSNISADILIDILIKNKNQLIKFVLLEDNQSDEDLNGEFAEGEEQDDGIEVEVYSNNKVSKYFLISALIKFNYLKEKNLIGLESYFKRIKIPYAKKYVNHLNKIYNKIMVESYK